MQRLNLSLAIKAERMIGNKKASNINGDFICEKFRRRKIYHNIYIQTVLQNCKAVCIFMIIAVEIKNFKTGKVMVLHCLACFDLWNTLILCGLKRSKCPHISISVHIYNFSFHHNDISIKIAGTALLPFLLFSLRLTLLYQRLALTTSTILPALWLLEYYPKKKSRRRLTAAFPIACYA